VNEEHMEWDDWKEQYDPVMVEQCHDDGILLELDTHQGVIAYFMDKLSHINEDDISKHVWTITSGDGWQYTSTGFHFVDRESYLICLNPWTKENEACMYDEVEGSWCDHCDGYTVSCEHDDEDWQDKQDMLAEGKANEE
jgi:hypothetical protein